MKTKIALNYSTGIGKSLHLNKTTIRRKVKILSIGIKQMLGRMKKMKTMERICNRGFPMKTTVTQCVFKRTRNSKKERGIAIGEVYLIIDKHNKPVTKVVWSYTLLWTEGTLVVDLG